MKNFLVVVVASVFVGGFFVHICIASGFDKQMEVHVRVLSDNLPVGEVDVKGGFKKRLGIDTPIIQHVLTDTNGYVCFTAESSGQVSLKIVDDEYYTHNESFDLVEQVIKGPVSTNRVIELKKIKNPVPMYAKDVVEFIPEDGKPIGYDLEKGDWVAPYGSGTKSDILFETNFDAENEKNFQVDFRVSFPGEHNGIQPMYYTYSELEGSRLKSDYLAPMDGYQTEIKCKAGRNKGVYSFKPPYDGKNAGYYFRIRTVLDEQGNIKSAQYGKIYGDFKFQRLDDTKSNIAFLYYFNPDKSRNVEFDPKRNLFLKQPEGGFLPLGRAKLEYSITAP